MQTAQIQHLTWIVVIVSSLWVLADAKALGVRKGLVRGLGNLGPVGWFLACLLLWFPSFFIYLLLRPKFKRLLAAAPGIAPPPQTVDFTPAAQVQVQARSGANGVQALVWGVLLIVAGLGLAGWGGWRSYEDVSSWVQARQQLHEIDSLTPEKLAQARQEAAQSDNPLVQFAGGFLMTPEMMNVMKTRAQSDMQAANANLQTDLPLFLFGLVMVYIGNGLLGRARKSP
ncbi:MAG: hypothetical protein ACP5GC_05555 [Thiomonas sp.]